MTLQTSWLFWNEDNKTPWPSVIFSLLLWLFCLSWVSKFSTTVVEICPVGVTDISPASGTFILVCSEWAFLGVALVMTSATVCANMSHCTLESDFSLAEFDLSPKIFQFALPAPSFLLLRPFPSLLILPMPPILTAAPPSSISESLLALVYNWDSSLFCLLPCINILMLNFRQCSSLSPFLFSSFWSHFHSS